VARHFDMSESARDTELSPVGQGKCSPSFTFELGAIATKAGQTKPQPPR
jgi:hypothetical protein